MRLIYRIMLLTFVIAIISLAAAGWRLIDLSLNTQRTAVLEAHNKRAAEIAKSIDENYIKIWLNSLGTVAATQQLYNLGHQERKALILALVKEYEDIDAIFLLDENNNQIVSAFEEEVVDSFSDVSSLLNKFVGRGNDEAIAGAKINDVYFGEPFKCDSLGSLYMNISMKTPLGNDKFGVLIGKISLSRLQEMVLEKQFRQRGQVYVVDINGKLITASDFNSVLSNVSHKSMVKSFMSAPGTGGSAPYTENKMEMLGAYAPLSNLAWAVIIEEPADDAYLAVTKMKREIFKWFFFAGAISVIGAIFISRSISKPISEVAKGSEEIAKGNYNFQIKKNTKRKDEIGQLTNSFNRMAKSLKEKEQIKGAFSRFVPPLVVREILKDLDHLELGGMRVKVAVMFVDIRGFTSISEKRPAEDVVEILNAFLDKMLHIVFKYQGTLDKFLGDGFMAFWGAPMQHDDDSLRAIKSALEMQKAMDDLNELFRKKYNLEIQIGIGLNYGDAIVGKTGAEMRMEYTAIGGIVNVASRLCGVAKAGQILISQPLFHEVEDDVVCDVLPPVRLKGIEKPFPLFEVKKLL